MSVTMAPLGFIGEAEGIETGVYPRRWDFSEAGDVLAGHRHGCPHATLVARGRVRLDTPTDSRVVEALAWVPVRAEDEHTLTALDPDTVVFCVFAGPAGAVA